MRRPWESPTLGNTVGDRHADSAHCLSSRNALEFTKLCIATAIGTQTGDRATARTTTGIAFGHRDRHDPPCALTLPAFLFDRHRMRHNERQCSLAASVPKRLRVAQRVPSLARFFVNYVFVFKIVTMEAQLCIQHKRKETLFPMPPRRHARTHSCF